MFENSEHAVLRQACESLYLQCDNSQIAALLGLRDLLLEWNTRFNLTGITDPSAVLVMHLVDSLTCLAAVPQELRTDSLRIADIGSGAGFPGLVLAIVMPQWQLTSFEATGKKVTFQQAVISTLQLKNAAAVHMRAEEAGRVSHYRLMFDLVTARALASLPVILEWGEPLLKPHGRLIAPKKGDLAEEMRQGSQAANILGGTQPEQIVLPPAIRTRFPELDDGRVLISVQQHYIAPLTYPRPGGMARKTPLGF